MTPKFVAIAGGTGAGKSTLAYALADKYPDRIGIVHLDDYHWHGENRSKVPIMESIMNWDHPDAIDWGSLICDLKKLKRGETVHLLGKDERNYPRSQYEKEEMETPRFPIEVAPHPILLLEGYMSLWDEKVRELLDLSIYLDAHHNLRMTRRSNFLNLTYEKRVLAPMHDLYIEPTKKFAKHAIDVANLTKEQVFEKVEKIILSQENIYGKLK